MLQPVHVAHKSLADYTHIVGRPLVEEVRELAEPLKGARVLHLSATAFGGGVAEILYTLVPLMQDVGLDAEWQVIYGREEFFNATKLMHNALQGNPRELLEEEWDVWRRYNEMNAKQLQGGWDVIIVHDPQPAGVHQHVPEKAESWVWRCHIDLSTPNPGTIQRLTPLVQEHDAFLFHMDRYVPAGLNGKRPPYIVPPAIDPLSPKNMALSPEDAAFVCDQFGIDVDRPLICQVSRFDPWKDPIGVIDAYRIVTAEMPDVQLALIGSMMPEHAATGQDPGLEATVQVEDAVHPSTGHLEGWEWERADEWYNFSTNVRGDAHVLLTMDETTYDPGSQAMGYDHPISWCKGYDGGRAWVTAMGHFGSHYSEPDLIDHLYGGVQWAAGAAEGCPDAALSVPASCRADRQRWRA